MAAKDGVEFYMTCTRTNQETGVQEFIFAFSFLKDGVQDETLMAKQSPNESLKCYKPEGDRDTV